jgi:hypothetical protein
LGKSEKQGNCCVQLQQCGLIDRRGDGGANTLNEYNKSDVAARTSRDAGKYVHVLPEKLSDYTRTIDNMKSYDQYYKGSYTRAVFDLDSFRVYSDRNQYFAQLSSRESYDSAYYGASDTNVQLRNEETTWKYTLLYKDGQWYIYGQSSIYNFDSPNTKMFDFKADAVSSTGSSTAGDEQAKVRAAVDTYEKKLIEAINSNNFSTVEPILTPGSELYNSQKALVENLAKKGITEELVSYEITDVKAGDKAGEYKATVKEKTTIKSPNSSETKDFNWVYTVVMNNNAYTLSNIKQP